jgi:cytochrome P450
VDAGAVDAGEVTFDEAVGMLLQMLSAGTDTTTSLIGRGARFLAEHDDVQDQLRDDPARIPTFVEEILRVDGPFRFHYRAARHDTELGGVRIPAGARLMLMWAAANLDEVTAPDPARVDLDRTGKKSHFAFGRGIHFCIGAPLARLEARVALEQLLVRTTQIRLDPDHPPRYRPTIFLRRLADLDVLFGTA